MTSPTPDVGALVISLDFELLWGWRDALPPGGGPYRNNLLGSRQVIPKMLDLFERYEVAATWAAVGMLFAGTRSELQRFQPTVRPQYADGRLCAYQEPLGEDESVDPVHFGRTLIDAIRVRPRQDIGTHTFSHFYCLEPGANDVAFAADLESAVAIAAHHDLRMRSIVFPRNQHNPAFARHLIKAGITTFRGTELHTIHRANHAAEYNRIYRRGGRLIDTYLELSGANVTAWADVPQANGLYNVPASCFLRPVSSGRLSLERLRFRRITRAMEYAAKTNGIYHLWWHPHNFGVNQRENLEFLTQIFEFFAKCQKQYGMQSFSMEGVVEAGGWR